MRELNFHHLLLFRAVARAGSFSRAAEQLAITQPSVSQQVSALERSLGVRLTERRGRGFRLTPAGERVAAYAERAVELAEQLAEEVAALRGGSVGQVVIGASTTTGEYVLPAALGRFRALYPGVTVRVEIANSARIEERVLAGEIDVGLVGEPVQRQGIVARQIGADRIVLVVSAHHRLVGRRALPEMLAHEPYIAREPGSATRATAEAALRAAGLAPTPVLELGSNDAVKRAAAATLGYAALSRLAVAPEIAGGWLVELDAPWFQCHRPLVLIQRDGRPIGAATRALLGLLPSVTASITTVP